MMRYFIVGCGDIGQRMARLAMDQGASVDALVRSLGKARQLELLGIRTMVADLDEPASLQGLPTKGATLCYFAPPPGGGHTDPRVRNFCAAIGQGALPLKVVYLSTTGVYGDCGDQPVSEETPVNPQTARARRRLDAEETFRAWGREHRIAVVVLRVTGIYGPGRLPMTQLMSGEPVLRGEEAPFTSRIHADDLARVCLAAAEQGENDEIFNVSDGQPGTLTDYFQRVAELLGLPQPRQVSRDEANRVMNPLLLSYFSESRRVDNRRMLERLGITLQYPDLATGLPSCREER